MLPATPSLQPSDIAGLREKFDLVKKLLASGAITEAEGQQLLEQFWIDHQVDSEARARRSRLAPTDAPIAYLTGDNTMNANDIVNQINENHALMSDQLKALSKIAPRPFPEQTGSLADLLQATVAGHVSNTADSLRALAEVEASMRSGKTDDPVIEAEFTREM